MHMDIRNLSVAEVFNLEKLCAVDEHGRCFVARLCFDAITRRKGILEIPGSLIGSAERGWPLCDELPNLDTLDEGMSQDTFASHWQQGPAKVMHHMIKKHEGELVEVEGWWQTGDGELPDALFDPQFGSTQEDMHAIRLLDTLSYTRSNKYASEYTRTKGKGKGKGKDCLLYTSDAADE